MIQPGLGGLSSEPVHDAEGGAGIPVLVGRVSQRLRIADEGKRRGDVVAGGAQGQPRAEFVFQTAAGASRKRNVGGLAFTAGVFAAQQPMSEAADLSVDLPMHHGPEQDRIHRWISGVAGDERVLVIGAVGGDAEVFAPIAGDGEVDALKTAARLVDLVEAGVAVSGEDLVLVGRLTLAGGARSTGWGNLACGRPGAERRRDHGQNRKQQRPLQLETLLNAVLWPASRARGCAPAAAPRLGCSTFIDYPLHPGSMKSRIRCSCGPELETGWLRERPCTYWTVGSQEGNPGGEGFRQHAAKIGAAGPLRSVRLALFLISLRGTREC